MSLFRSRRRYRPLVPPMPVLPGQILLPDIDLDVIKHDGAAAVWDLAAQAEQVAPAIGDAQSRDSCGGLEDAITSGFKIDEPAVIDELRRWCRVGWALGQLEIDAGVAKQGRSERHHYAALMMLRGRLSEAAAQGEARGFRDALRLGLEGAYYLRLSPAHTPLHLAAAWKSEVVAYNERLAARTDVERSTTPRRSCRFCGGELVHAESGELGHDLATDAALCAGLRGGADIEAL